MTGSAGTGLIQAMGAGSGLDIGSLVTQLVAAERAPTQARITRQATDVATQLSALGTLKGALAGFQSALAPLKTVDQFALRSATSADPDVFAVSANSRAAPGTYAVEVRQLAQSAQMVSQAHAEGAATVLGPGTLRLDLGADKSFSVTLAAGKDTLADLRDAINKATDNPGINATLVYGTDGARLVLTSNATGAGNAIQATVTDGDMESFNFTQQQAAQDAIVMISGVEHHAATNVIDAAIDGVTLTLKAANTGSTVRLDVANDRAGVIANVRRFVNGYNAMQGQLTALGNYDATAKKGGPLQGDALLMGISAAMTRGATDRVAGAGGNYDSLAAIGITTDASGQFKLDEAKLTKALQAEPGAVAALFGGSDGVAARLSTKIDSTLATDGVIAARDKNLGDAQKRIVADTDRLNQRMDVVQQRYIAQFTALDRLLAQLNSTSKYLNQQLSSIASIGKDDNSR
jgi:flagellar hook-associated protein 2